jgi:hypothetical protein
MLYIVVQPTVPVLKYPAYLPQHHKIIRGPYIESQASSYACRRYKGSLQTPPKSALLGKMEKYNNIFLYLNILLHAILNNLFISESVNNAINYFFFCCFHLKHNMFRP